MYKYIRSSWKLLLPLQLAACGSDTPSFQEKPQALIQVAVNKAEDPSEMSGESFDIDTLDTDANSADATVGTESFSDENDVSSNGATLPARNTAPSRGPIQQDEAEGRFSSDTEPLPIPDSKAVAKACAPAMKNLGKAMTVVSVQESNSTITISPNSVIALRIVGNRTKVVLGLDGATPLLGVCFFLAGHETELEFTTASTVKSLAVVEAGDQAKASISLTAGSSESLSVDLRGHSPSLSIQGVSAELCDSAQPRKANVTFQCQP